MDFKIGRTNFTPKLSLRMGNQYLHLPVSHFLCAAEVPHPPVTDSDFSANNDKKIISREDIGFVQNLIERCLQLYMNRGEVVRTLSNRARIEPSFTTLVWQKLKEENSEFFRAYYTRLKLKKQIIIFNHLLEHQYHLMNYPVPLMVPLAPIQNEVHPIPDNKLPMGYPIIHQPQMQLVHTNFDSVCCRLSKHHVVNGIPAPVNFCPIKKNSVNNSILETDPSAAVAVSPAPAASSNHFPFMSPEVTDMGLDTAVLDVACMSDGGVGSSTDSIRSLGQFWNYGLSNLAADLINLGDPGPIGSYPGSPFLPSDSDILLDSPEQDKGIKPILLQDM